MATVDTSTYTQTIVTEPTAPSTESMFDLDIMAPLLREIVADGIIDEPKLSQDLDSARSFFTGQSIIKSDFLLSNLKFGQQVRVNIEKDQNPLSLFQKSEIEYKSIDACHDQIDLDCTVPCINTLPTFQNLIFRFDTEYAYGVRACDKNKDFWEFDLLSRVLSQLLQQPLMLSLLRFTQLTTGATRVLLRLMAAHSSLRLTGTSRPTSLMSTQLSS